MLDVTLTALEQEGLKRSIIKTLTYADVFDYPLTLHEIHRYLVEEHATVEQVHEGLSAGDFVSQNIVEKSIYYALPGRDQIIETRLNRSKIAFGLWPAAIKYGAMMARLPFVRMVAVTGSLAVDNESTNDIDYLIVTKPGRLWLCRAMVILVVRWARLQGVEVCPNYLISENALLINRRDLYVAHELSQMVPLSGLGIYNLMREVNGWTDKFLPNARGLPRTHIRAEERIIQNPLTRFAEWLLSSRPAGWLEKWEMKRKIRKFNLLMPASEEADFSQDWCKGHFGEYGKQAMGLYTERIQVRHDIVEIRM
ncbi:MAG: hypothetical protein A2Z16_07190 [Chloroflexi bacterium RBG_16_54_18]|nr:MAG: hypothetical protein A2Z16_07190 [Chloroflexi bacterium RBG_16_54_18]